MTNASPTTVAAPTPPEFLAAIASLNAVKARDEVTLEQIRAPQRLAPYSFALGAEVHLDPNDSIANATGRLVLLHDPDGDEAWDGTFRLVSYVSASLDTEMAGDPMLAEVAWSWLTDALDAHNAPYVALGGTITQTSSTRFGDLAGPASVIDLEIRASWTAVEPELAGHLKSWIDLLSSATGAPPPGVRLLTRDDRTK